MASFPPVCAGDISSTLDNRPRDFAALHSTPRAKPSPSPTRSCAGGISGIPSCISEIEKPGSSLPSATDDAAKDPTQVMLAFKKRFRALLKARERSRKMQGWVLAGVSDEHRLDKAFLAAEAAAATFDEFPVTLAEDVELEAFDAWAAAKAGAGSFIFFPSTPGSTKGCAQWATDTDDVQHLIAMSIYDQLAEQLLQLGGPFHGPEALKALQLCGAHHRIGTHSRKPHLAVRPSSPTRTSPFPSLVVEAVFLQGSEQHEPSSLDLWMSDDTDTQAAIEVVVHVGEAALPHMVAYIAQRGGHASHAIPFGPDSACVQSGLAQFCVRLPLCEVFHGVDPPARLSGPYLHIDLFALQREVCSVVDVWREGPDLYCA